MSILVDANILVYAALPSMAEHTRSRAWLDERFGDADDYVGLCWQVLYPFVRIVSNRRIMGNDAVGLRRAWEAAEVYRTQPTVRLVEPGRTHPRIAAELIVTPGLGADDVPDVGLAALAIEHGLVLCSHDHGFGRFAGLRWKDPLT